ncbi:hypothetical protein ACLB1N_29935 [Escherichia coli]
MLRDKFIHYFQQWRERQLSRGEHWLAQHLAGVPRERACYWQRWCSCLASDITSSSGSR